MQISQIVDLKPLHDLFSHFAHLFFFPLSLGQGVIRPHDCGWYHRKCRAAFSSYDADLLGSTPFDLIVLFFACLSGRLGKCEQQASLFVGYY